MALSKAARTERAKVAALSRDRAPNDPKLTEAKNRLRVLTFEDRVRSLVENAPPLTAEQMDRIAALFKIGGGAA